MKKLSILMMISALAACDPGLGASRIGDTIIETGTLDCADRVSRPDAPVVGTEADPLRCGPQTQAIPG